MNKIHAPNDINDDNILVRVGMVGPDKSTYNALVRAGGAHFNNVELIGYASDPDRFQLVAETDTLLLETESHQQATAAVRAWREAGYTMNVLVVAESVTDAWLAELRRFGVVYVLHKPMPADIMWRRLCQFSVTPTRTKAAMATAGRAVKAEQRLIHVLDALQVPSDLSGYRYLTAAIMIMWGQGNNVRMPIVSLYKTVARRYGTGAAAVERAMRYAVEATWLRGNVDIINELFGYTVCPEKGKPTNALFISRLVDYVRLSTANSMGIDRAGERNTKHTG